jgi:hypothetical protein
MKTKNIGSGKARRAWLYDAGYSALLGAKAKPLLAYECLHQRQWFTNLRCKVQKPLSQQLDLA